MKIIESLIDDYLQTLECEMRYTSRMGDYECSVVIEDNVFTLSEFLEFISLIFDFDTIKCHIIFKWFEEKKKEFFKDMVDYLKSFNLILGNYNWYFLGKDNKEYDLDALIAHMKEKFNGFTHSIINRYVTQYYSDKQINYFNDEKNIVKFGFNGKF